MCPSVPTASLALESFLTTPIWGMKGIAMHTSTAPKPAWNIKNGTIEPNTRLAELLVQQRLIKQQLQPLQTGLVGAILAREFALNPSLAAFKVEISLLHGTSVRLTVEELLDLKGQQAPFDLFMEMTDDDEIEVLFNAFDKNEFGIVEIHCKRQDIETLLGSRESINGVEAFEKLFPHLRIIPAQAH